MTQRFKVVKGSQSAHCCFDFTVVDTAIPFLIGGEQYEGRFEEVCECFEEKDAELIARALNSLGEKERE